MKKYLSATIGFRATYSFYFNHIHIKEFYKENVLIP